MAGGEISRAEHLSLPPTISEEPMKAKILVYALLSLILPAIHLAENGAKVVGATLGACSLLWMLMLIA
jgi:hypothetical protein